MGFLVEIFKLLASLFVLAIVVVKFFTGTSWQEAFGTVESRLREYHVKWKKNCPFCADGSSESDSE
jgi:hypothetical protein